MAQSQSTQKKNLPQAGDILRCEKCGMELEVKQDCQSPQQAPRLECCGQPLTQA